MATLGNIFARFLDINALKRILAILGCLLFLISFISPFYTFSMLFTFSGESSFYYWSYKFDDLHDMNGHIGSSQTWFSNYWFSPYLYMGFSVSWILVLMFTIQILTLFFGVASIIFNRRMLSYAPVLLGLLTIALMLYIGKTEENYFGGYQLGYYLVFPSLVLFLSAFVLNEVTKNSPKYKTTDLPHGIAE